MTGSDQKVGRNLLGDVSPSPWGGLGKREEGEGWLRLRKGTKGKERPAIDHLHHMGRVHGLCPSSPLSYATKGTDCLHRWKRRHERSEESLRSDFGNPHFLLHSACAA